MQHHIQTKRSKVAYRTYGDPSLPPLILVHGWPQSSYCWHEVAQTLTDYYIIAPDLRGLGDSERTLDLRYYTKDELGKDIFALADALNIEDFYLGGHDWGSAVVQEMALAQPERIKKLVLINMMIINNHAGKKKAAEKLVKGMFKSSWYQFFQSIPDFPEALIAGKEDVWIRFFSRGISRPIPEDAIAEYTRCYQIPHTITTGANLYRAIPKDRERWKTYLDKKITVPTHIIHGELDPVVIKAFLYKAETAFEHPIDITYLKGGHFICDEQPQAVAEAIQVFLAKP
ncbi:MAG: alpha/beta hydrolase [Candidatus Arcticimaribacter sp.]